MLLTTMFRRRNHTRPLRSVRRRTPRAAAVSGVERFEDRTLLTAYVVDTLVDNPADASTVTDTKVSLREAIEAANTNAAFGDAAEGSATETDTITFAPALFAGGPATITLGGTELTISDELAIDGPGADQLTIDANSLSRVFSVTGGTTASIDGLTLANGSDTNGGAIDNAGTLSLTGVRITGSDSVGHGGAIDNAGTLTILASTLDANTAGEDGGAIYSSGTATLTNVTISGNRADENGGGISNDGGTLTVNFGTIVLNQADFDGVAPAGIGGGIYTGTGGTTELTNTVVAGNTAGAPGSDVPDDLNGPGTVDATSVYNLIGDAATAGGLTATPENGNIIGGITIANLDTVLNTTLADNGGPTPTHALVLAGDAVDAGDPNFDPAVAGIPFDQRGAGFARVQRGGVDIGAFEVQNTPPVAQDDEFTTDDNDDPLLTGDLLADNGNGADADADGDPLEVTEVNGAALPVGGVVTLPSGAIVTVNADGTFTYDTNGAFDDLLVGESDTDTFTYTITDPFGATDTATVTVTIEGANDDPVTPGFTGRTASDTPLPGQLTATDAENEALTYALLAGPAPGVGTVNVNGDGSFTFTPGPDLENLAFGETQTVTFTYTVTDGSGGTTTGTATILVYKAGKGDLVGYYGGQWWAYLSDGTKFVPPADGSAAATWGNLAWEALRQGDFNADGLTDVLGFVNGEWWVGLADGTGKFVGEVVDGVTDWTWGPSWRATADWDTVLVGDLNGDGADDILAAAVYNGYQYWYGALSDTATTFLAPTLWFLTRDVNWSLETLADADGDGSEDLILNRGGNHWYVGLAADAVQADVDAAPNDSWAVPTLWGDWEVADYDALRTGDFNGDGKTDILALLNGTWYVGLSDGAAFGREVYDTWAATDWLDVQVADFDGDGRDDVAAHIANGTNWVWYVAYSGADGLYESRTQFARWVDSSWLDVRAADVDGDGRADLTARLNGAWWVSRATSARGSAATAERWATWANVAWQAVDVTDVGEPVVMAPAAAASGGASLAAATAEEDELDLFWSQAEEDEAFAGGLLAGV